MQFYHFWSIKISEDRFQVLTKILQDLAIKNGGIMPAHITLRKSIEFAATTEDMGAKFYSDLASKFSHNQEMSELFFPVFFVEKIIYCQYEKDRSNTHINQF